MGSRVTSVTIRVKLRRKYSEMIIEQPLWTANKIKPEQKLNLLPKMTKKLLVGQEVLSSSQLSAETSADCTRSYLLLLFHNKC